MQYTAIVVELVFNVSRWDGNLWKDPKANITTFIEFWKWGKLDFGQAHAMHHLGQRAKNQEPKDMKYPLSLVQNSIRSFTHIYYIEIYNDDDDKSEIST